MCTIIQYVVHRERKGEVMKVNVYPRNRIDPTNLLRIAIMNDEEFLDDTLHHST